jgi:WD40 repeat protein
VFSPDGRRLLTAGPFTIHRWDLATHQAAASFDLLSITRDTGLSSMAVSGTGGRLAVATVGKVLWLDLMTWKQVAPPLPVDHNSGLERLTLSPDERLLAMTTTPITTGGTPGRSTAVLWDLASRRQLRSLDADGALAFSPDGRTLAASHRQRGEILLLDPVTGKRRRTLSGHSAGVLALRFSHDGAALASTDEDGTVIVWDLATGRARETLQGHAAGVTGVVFSPDDRTLYTASSDKRVIVWDLAGDRRLGRPFAAGRRVSSQTFGPSQSFGKGGALLARGHDDGTVTLVDLARRVPVGTPLRAHRSAVRAVALSRDGRLLATADADTVILWDLTTPKPTRRPIGVFTDTVDLAISPDGRTLAISDGSGVVTLQDLASAPSRRWPLQHADVSLLEFSPDGAILAVAFHGQGGEVWLWDVAGRSLLHRLPADRSWVSALAFAPDGRTLATGGGEGKVLLWDTRTARQLGPPLAGHAGAVASAAFSPDGRVLATVHGEAILWDVASHKQIGAALPTRSSEPPAMAFLPGGNQLAAASPSGSVLVWDVNRASWQARACRVAGRTLTRQEWDELLPGRPYQPACPAGHGTHRTPSRAP